MNFLIFSFDIYVQNCAALQYSIFQNQLVEGSILLQGYKQESSKENESPVEKCLKGEGEKLLLKIMKDVHQKLQNSNNPEYSADILIAQNIFNNSISMFQEDDSCYSNDEEYFSDLCRGGEIEECKEFLDGLNEESNFNWGWFNDRQENFIHMLAANNHVDMFDFVFLIVKKKCSSELVEEILNKKNSEQNTPLHYAVITDCKEMVTKLLEAGANANISNQHSRTPFEEAQQFGKFEIAEILANVTKLDIKQIQKMASDLKLNDDSSDEDEEPPIMEKIEEKDQQPKQQS